MLMVIAVVEDIIQRFMYSLQLSFELINKRLRFLQSQALNHPIICLRDVSGPDNIEIFSIL